MYVTEMKGDSIMSSKTKREYLAIIVLRYRRATKKHKQLILNEFCQVCGYHRKYAIRLLNGMVRSASPSRKGRCGRKPCYTNPRLVEFLKTLWRASNLACGKRLKAMIPLWLPHYRTAQGRPLPPEVIQQLKTISAATIDRLLRPVRARFAKIGLATTKPGSLLRKHIPLGTNQWDQTTPGFLEADTVAHCGSSTAGMYVLTVNTVDIASGWTEQRAVWGKGEQGVLKAITSIEEALPFSLLGFDCDNGSEFLNWHLMKHLTDRRRPVQYTRSREYQKNDNAHIEGKNWTHVRQYLGYERFDRQQTVDELNALYTSHWRLFLNFFMPSVKLLEKRRVGSKIIKRHDAPQTPLRRLLASPHISPHTKQRLQSLAASLNPFELQQHINSEIKRILRPYRTTSPQQSLIPQRESLTQSKTTKR